MCTCNKIINCIYNLIELCEFLDLNIDGKQLF